MAAKILVVDASLTVRKQVASILQHQDFSVVEAESAESCLTSLKGDSSIVAVFCGLDLKGSQPATVTRDIERFLSPKQPLILMFGNDRDVQFCDWMARSGVKGCVTKPINADTLVTVLKRVLAA